MPIKKEFILFLLLALAAAVSRAQSLSISSLGGPVTQTEINSFITYMQSQTPPPTPWGPVDGTGHNDWADGTGGRDLEAMGEMFLVSSNLTILNNMISWADNCTSQRNDLMSVANGGQRVLWTGLIDKVWCPNWLTDATDGQSNYCGCETEDVIGHLAFCSKLILQTPAIWNETVPDGNPYGYGATYFQRATNYLEKCDEANDEYFLKWFIQPGTSLIVPPTNAAWVALNENVTANNRQMMFTSGFQRLAEAHQLLGDNPARVTQYNAIVQATINQDLSGMVNFDQYQKNGQTVYDWGYYPTTDAPEATEIHAEYDIIGVWRAFNNPAYGVTLAPLVPFANTMVDVIYLGTNTFAGDVDGGSGTQSPIYSGWFWTADWNPQVYNVVAGAAYTNGWYSGSPDIDAAILFMKNRRYLQFSVTPSPSSQVVQAGNETAFTLAVAPLGGSTNTVGLAINGLPSGATAGFSPATVNCATLNFASTNSTLSIQTALSTPLGSYTLSIISTNGNVAHTNLVNLVVGNYSVSVSPSAQTVSLGASTSYSVTTTTNSGFSGTVSFGLGGLPAGCSAQFSPASLSGAGSVTLSVTASNSATLGDYTLTIYATNGASVTSTTAGLDIVIFTSAWTGSSSSDSDWNDSANWGGIPLSAGTQLSFGGNNRLININNTTAGTTYSNIVFNAGAGAFVLNGNSIALIGNIINDSANPQTINLGLNFGSSFSLTGASNALDVLGGLTNTAGAPGTTTLTLDGPGQLSDLWNNTSNPGGTNVILLNDSAANWTIIHNAAATGAPVPWVFEINQGTLNFGTPSSAPNVSSTTTHNEPKDTILADNSGFSATLNISNGVLTINGPLDTCQAASTTSIINQAGGTLNVNGSPYYFQGANGGNTGEDSIENISGGTMNMGTTAAPYAGPFYVASRGNGALTLSGSGALNCSTLDVSRNAQGNTFGSVGVVNLDGGTITCSRVGTATANAQTNGLLGSLATVNFNGGTLRAGASSATFYQGSTALPAIPITSYVLAGGAIINDGGNAITFLEPLQSGTAHDGGLTKLGSGTVTLGEANTYNGNTVIGNGVLALSGSSSIADSANIIIAGGATFNVSALSSAFTLSSGQILSNSASTATINGSLATSSGTLSLTYAAGTPSLNLAGGTLTLSPNTVINIYNTGAALPGGVYTLIAAGGGTVGGTLPSSVAMNGNGLAAGATASLQTASGALQLVVTPHTPFITGISLNGTTLTITASNGPNGEPFVLMGSTNLLLPLNQWTPLLTNHFDGSGNLNLSTNIINPANPLEFYFLQTP
jgi:autotransporter-associated beta strand protein